MSEPSEMVLLPATVGPRDVNEAGSDPVCVAVERLPDGADLPFPRYMTPGAAGADACAAVHEDLTLPPGGRALVSTGFTVAVPAGYELQVRPRSGLALRHGVTILNAPGTIDSDYRGPLGVLLANFGSEPFVIRRGDRIAQLVLAPVARAQYVAADCAPSARGAGGFGSTGT